MIRLNNIIRHLAPRGHYTPITVVWKIRQALMGGYVPMENPPFTAKTKELWQRNYTEARR